MKRILPAILTSISLPLSLICGSENLVFEQIASLLPTPNEARLATGLPGPDYWQQEANYQIKVELDEANSRISGSETVEYINHSPHTLPYLWVQLDQNTFAQDSKRQRSIQALNFDPDDGKPRELEFRGFRNFIYNQEFEGGYELGSVTDLEGNALPFTVVGTNMRINLEKPLSPGESFSFKVEWSFNLQDEAMSMRHGRRKLKTGDYIYQVAQWYPRMCAYYDQEGWQIKPYIGHGEFALEFGAFEVQITVPEDFVVAATGTLVNAGDVLTSKMRERLKNARTSDQAVMIITEEEAEQNLKRKARGKKTWHFKAEIVRDFAFAGSRGYLWDALGVEVDGETVMAMSLYPSESTPVWKRYSPKR
jgi:hypothetical protein